MNDATTSARAPAPRPLHVAADVWTTLAFLGLGFWKLQQPNEPIPSDTTLVTLAPLWWFAFLAFPAGILGVVLSRFRPIRTQLFPPALRILGLALVFVLGGLNVAASLAYQKTEDEVRPVREKVAARVAKAEALATEAREFKPAKLPKSVSVDIPPEQQKKLATALADAHTLKANTERKVLDEVRARASAGEAEGKSRLGAVKDAVAEAGPVLEEPPPLPLDDFGLKRKEKGRESFTPPPDKDLGGGDRGGLPPEVGAAAVAACAAAGVALVACLVGGQILGSLFGGDGGSTKLSKGDRKKVETLLFDIVGQEADVPQEALDAIKAYHWDDKEEAFRVLSKAMEELQTRHPDQAARVKGVVDTIDEVKSAHEEVRSAASSCYQAIKAKTDGDRAESKLFEKAVLARTNRGDFVAVSEAIAELSDSCSRLRSLRHADPTRCLLYAWMQKNANRNADSAKKELLGDHPWQHECLLICREIGCEP